MIGFVGASGSPGPGLEFGQTELSHTAVRLDEWLASFFFFSGIEETAGPGCLGENGRYRDRGWPSSSGLSSLPPVCKFAPVRQCGSWWRMGTQGPSTSLGMTVLGVISGGLALLRALSDGWPFKPGFGLSGDVHASQTLGRLTK